METDWLKLWRELVAINNSGHKEHSSLRNRYEEHAQKHSERFDPLLDFVLKNIGKNETVLEIGAGNGRWTLPIARKCKSVTAIEPSPDMRTLLRRNIEAAGLKNVEIVPASWENAAIRTHDVGVCAHAMYSNPDIASFVHKLEQHTKKTCYLAIRLPAIDGIIGELSTKIHGTPHDSPNAIVAFNALYSMGICANALVENEVYRWENKTLDEAFSRAKHHLRLDATDEYDRLIWDTLKSKLIRENDIIMWPDGMRSALLWWNPRPFDSSQTQD